MSRTSRSVVSNDAPSTPVTPEPTGRAHASAGPSLRTADRQGETLSAVERHERIAVAAWYRAERRGFVPGFDLEDWLEAEATMENEADG